MTLSPMTVTLRIKQKGLTLLETVLALAVGVVIIMSVLIYFQTASNNANMSATIKITSDIGNAVRTYAQSPSYKGSTTINLVDLQSAGLLSGADTVNPWSGPIVVSTSGNYLGITFYNVPAQSTTDSTTKITTITGSCALLAAQLSRALPLPSPGTVTLNGTTYKYTGNYTITNPSGGGVGITTPTGNSKKVQGAAVCQYSSGATGQLTVVMDLT